MVARSAPVWGLMCRTSVSPSEIHRPLSSTINPWKNRPNPVNGTEMVWTTWFVAGSIRTTVPSASLVAQIWPLCAAMYFGDPCSPPIDPIVTVAATSFVAGSMRETVPSPELAIQRVPSVVAIACGSLPTGIVATTSPGIGRFAKAVAVAAAMASSLAAVAVSACCAVCRVA